LLALNEPDFVFELKEKPNRNGLYEVGLVRIDFAAKILIKSSVNPFHYSQFYIHRSPPKFDFASESYSLSRVNRHQNLDARAGKPHILAYPVVVRNPSAVDDELLVIPVLPDEIVKVSESHNIELPDASLPSHQPLGDAVCRDIHPHTDIVTVNEKKTGIQNFGDLKEVFRQVKVDILLSPEFTAEKLINHIVKVRRGRCELAHITMIPPDGPDVDLLEVLGTEGNYTGKNRDCSIEDLLLDHDIKFVESQKASDGLVMDIIPEKEKIDVIYRVRSPVNSGYLRKPFNQNLSPLFRNLDVESLGFVPDLNVRDEKHKLLFVELSTL